ncbi:hypothetical protein D3C77_313970 [compost metagenome]
MRSMVCWAWLPFAAGEAYGFKHGGMRYDSGSGQQGGSPVDGRPYAALFASEFASQGTWFLDKKKAGGGILMNLGAHSIDKIQWLTNSRITKVKAALSYEGERGNVEGSGCIFLETSNGVPAVIVQSGYTGVAKDETELIFSRGMIKLISAKGVWVSREGQYEELEPRDASDPFVLQFKDLLQAIQSKTEPDSSGQYARSVITALEAVYRSGETGVEQQVDN